jgi:Plasmid encoded RepA protein
MTTEAVRTKQRELVLGDSMSEFMGQLDMLPTGGRWGSITRLRDQSRRLFTTSVSCFFDGENAAGESGFRIADRHLLWWDPQSPNQKSLFNSTVMLSERFYDEVRTSPVPIDMRAMKALKKSPLALDIYFWLTYRLSYLRQARVIPWAALQMQFGSSYGADAHGLRDFKRAFLRELKKVSILYPKAKVGEGEGGLQLQPSATHIPLRSRPPGNDA